MIELKVTGMTCNHCEATVKTALEKVSGVDRVMVVDSDMDRAIVKGSADPQALVAAIKAEGYESEVTSVED